MLLAVCPGAAGCVCGGLWLRCVAFELMFSKCGFMCLRIINCWICVFLGIAYAVANAII